MPTCTTHSHARAQPATPGHVPAHGSLLSRLSFINVFSMGSRAVYLPAFSSGSDDVIVGCVWSSVAAAHWSFRVGCKVAIKRKRGTAPNLVHPLQQLQLAARVPQLDRIHEILFNAAPRSRLDEGDCNCNCNCNGLIDSCTSFGFQFGFRFHGGSHAALRSPAPQSLLPSGDLAHLFVAIHSRAERIGRDHRRCQIHCELEMELPHPLLIAHTRPWLFA